MAKVSIDLSMSLDGFITGPSPNKENALGGNDGMRLHEWYFSGDKPSRFNDNFKPGKGSEALVNEMFTSTGALVVGRKWYDATNGWEGNHPIQGVPIFVVTHYIPADKPKGASPITYVTDGVESAVKQAKGVAGDKTVTVGGANIAQQCLKAGLLDELLIHLVPVLLGEGTRLFEGLELAKLECIQNIQTPDVTHLRYKVVK